MLPSWCACVVYCADVDSNVKINGVKEYLDENQGNSEDEDVEADDTDNSSPILLLGNSKPASKEEVLLDVPPRSIADRLVSRFLKTSEPARSK